MVGPSAMFLPESIEVRAANFDTPAPCQCHKNKQAISWQQRPKTGGHPAWKRASPRTSRAEKVEKQVEKSYLEGADFSSQLGLDARSDSMVADATLCGRPGRSQLSRGTGSSDSKSGKTARYALLRALHNAQGSNCAAQPSPDMAILEVCRHLLTKLGTCRRTLQKKSH